MKKIKKIKITTEIELPLTPEKEKIAIKHLKILIHSIGPNTKEAMLFIHKIQHKNK